ncbi:MAG: hypothetical protein H0T70_11225 [Acidimicrobiia bacterium]|nr:hypothetical protein [Acidimicrobiia bacterium]
MGALKWNPQVRGALYVVIAMVVLPGSAFLLLSTNMGARLGFLLAAAGFCGWMFTLGGVWLIYGSGPKGREPSWKPQETIVGEVSEASRNPAAARYPAGWEKLEITNPEVADAIAVVDTIVVGPKNMFKSASDYLPVAAAEKGGETYGPFHLANFRPFDVFHEPHFLVIQVQKAITPEAVAGQPPPSPAVDPQAPIVSVLMVRDLGAVRENPAVVCLSFGLLFGVTCYRLHIRDKEAMAQRG